MATKLGNVIADFTTQLTTLLSIGGTTATLATATDDDGVALPAGIYFLTLDGGNAQKEHIVCSLSGTALTAISSVSRQGVETSGAARLHRVGATVTLTDFAHLLFIDQLLMGTIGLDSAHPLFYDANFSPTLGLFNIPTWDYVKSYADALAIAGAPDASTSVKGISKLTSASSTTLGTATITIASPGVVSFTSHGLIAGDTVKFTTSGSLPTGITAGTSYYVIAAGLTANAFEISVTSGGSAINTTGSQSGTHTLFRTTPFAVGNDDPRLPTQGENDAMVGDNTDIAVGTSNKYVTQTGLQKSTEKYAVSTGSSTNTISGNPTITIASPAVITQTSHGLVAGDPVKFTTSGALPTGITASTTYYVITAGLTANAFEIAATPGGAAINTSGSQSGTHTSARPANTYEVTLSPVPISYSTLEFTMKANFTNTDAPFINVNGLGGILLKKQDGATALIAGDIVNGQLVHIRYDGTFLQMQSPIGNPTASTSYISAITSSGNITTTQNIDTVITCGFPPKTITLYYSNGGVDNGTSKVSGGVALYNSAGTLLNNIARYTNQITSVTLTPNLTAFDATNPSAGSTTGTSNLVVMSITAVSATGFTVRSAFTAAGGATGFTNFIAVVTF